MNGIELNVHSPWVAEVHRTCIRHNWYLKTSKEITENIIYNPDNLSEASWIAPKIRFANNNKSWRIWSLTHLDSSSLPVGLWTSPVASDVESGTLPAQIMHLILLRDPKFPWTNGGGPDLQLAAFPDETRVRDPVLLDELCCCGCRMPFLQRVVPMVRFSWRFEHDWWKLIG